jgi:hypothetical protein
MFNITQTQINNEANTQSLVLNTKGILNPRYRNLIKDFERLSEPSTLLKAGPSPAAKEWKLPEIKQGPKGQFTLDSHISIFGTAPSWNYLVLARDIMGLNNLDKLPSLASIKACLKGNDVKAKDCVKANRESREINESNFVKDTPIEEVLDILFGNSNIQWKEAAALVKGIDGTGKSKIYQGYTTEKLEEPVDVDFIKSPLMIMPNGQNFDRFRLFNALMQTYNEPVVKVPKEFKIAQFKEAPLEWNCKQPALKIYQQAFDEGVKGIGDSPYLVKQLSKETVCLFDQICEMHLDRTSLYRAPQETPPVYDDEDAQTIEKIKRSKVGDEFKFRGKKDPMAFYLYSLKEYGKRWDWKSILGYKE